MKPVFQKIFDDRKGDCFAACLASLLEIPLEEVPNFRDLQEQPGGKDMVWQADEWLREKHSKRFLGIEIYHPGGGERTDICLLNRLFCANQNEFVLLSGESPRKNVDGSKKYHCVIGKADCWGFEVVHDPHPEGGGIVGQPYGVKWILPIQVDSYAKFPIVSGQPDMSQLAGDTFLHPAIHTEEP